ncbi:DUF1440 domain-containing protein [Ktedonospora formicarum]|uniref:DUF1440 domain-containing protein n=1 Tax=Ktedonospora formicarum TaxID=2778364 RepID=A0A8J3I8N5_9CHLR|nr:DUF1440 domain-containing protein [Ktedonospora formicarum]GHO49486.1 hypothetical protein KSX_76490 [Ktedonospora formicarum]
MATSSTDTKSLIASPVVTGAIAGCLATIPMSIFMLLAQRYLPHEQRYSLPPEIITYDIARRANLHWKLSKRQTVLATLGAHLGYGAAVGILYAPLCRLLPTKSPLIKGSIVGLLVWIGSYMALLPLLRVAESAYREPLHRNVMMLVAHQVWGGATGLIATGWRQNILRVS